MAAHKFDSRDHKSFIRFRDTPVRQNLHILKPGTQTMATLQRALEHRPARGVISVMDLGNLHTGGKNDPLHFLNLGKGVLRIRVHPLDQHTGAEVTHGGGHELIGVTCCKDAGLEPDTSGQEPSGKFGDACLALIDGDEVGKLFPAFHNF